MSRADVELAHVLAIGSADPSQHRPNFVGRRMLRRLTKALTSPHIAVKTAAC